MTAPSHQLPSPVLIEIITNDCGCGFSGYAVLSDGTTTAHTQTLYASREQAAAAVANTLDHLGGTR
jgi:hypothetical protein